jgi:hypothetical protein
MSAAGTTTGGIDPGTVSIKNVTPLRTGLPALVDAPGRRDQVNFLWYQRRQNPAVTIARSLSDTFAGIAPGGASVFVIAQLLDMFAAVGLTGCPWTNGEVRLGSSAAVHGCSYLHLLLLPKLTQDGELCTAVRCLQRVAAQWKRCISGCQLAPDARQPGLLFARQAGRAVIVGKLDEPHS